MKTFSFSLVVSILFVANVWSVGGLSGGLHGHGMRVFPDEQKFTVIDNDAYSIAESPSKQGWYYSVASVANTPTGLVAVYRRSDFHTAVMTDIMVAYSNDGGRSWKGHHRIAQADVWNELGCWVAPQLSRLSDGRLVIISDFGHRDSGDDWPMLSTWQKPHRGMWNYLFWSDDDGKTWSDPIKIDDVGGEPGYITETESGVLLYTRTESKQTNILWNPPSPWNDIYYYNSAVLSFDGGKTWDTAVTLADDPHHGDCEVGTVDLGDGRLMAVTRIGLGNGQFRNPSRIAYSYDDGRTWTDHQLSPFYAQRPIIRRLQSGNLLLHYRNRWGTPAIYAVLLKPDEKLPYEPAIFLYEEDRCKLEDNVLTLRTEEGIKNLVTYGFYPAHNPASKVEIEATLKVESADINACNISAGCWIRFEPGRISLADRPGDGFDIDTTQWRDYRIVRENGILRISVDGQIRLETDVSDLLRRDVVVGNRQVKSFNWNHVGDEAAEGWGTAGVSHWKALKVTVQNPYDYTIEWDWNARDGYPDPFRRDRIIALDIIASSPGHTGYGGSTQLEDGTIVILDYTVGGNGGKPARMPFIRSYILTEDMFELED
jgi:hypothetical protein